MFMILNRKQMYMINLDKADNCFLSNSDNLEDRIIKYFEKVIKEK